REQLGAGPIVLAKLGDAHSDHGDAAHAVSLKRLIVRYLASYRAGSPNDRESPGSVVGCAA
ncbi:MAG TPA: hypothetical protein VIE41_20910, partial [Methylomirabilota bacterium]